MSTSTSFTFATLSTRIQVFLEEAGAEYTASLEDIISLGESRLATDLNFEIFDRVATGALTAGVFVQAIKTGTWQGTRSLHLRDVGGGGPFRFLRRRTYEWCLDFEPDETATAEPEYYAEFTETEFFVTPAPDVTYGFETREIRGPEHLSAANQNTWLGDNAGDLLLYATLISSEEFLKSVPADIQTWKDTYGETMGVRRLELRRQIRDDYDPSRNASRTAEDKP